MDASKSIELSKAVSDLVSEAVLTRVFHEIDVLDNTEICDEQWLSRVMDVFKFCKSAEMGFGHGKAYALAVLRKHWEEIDFDVRKKLGFTFNIFAQAATGKEQSTIDGYIRTAQVWFISKSRPLGQIQVTVRQADGRPALDGNTYVKQYVEFNPFTVDLSKLLICNNRAASGTMTPKLWEMLADPYVTWKELHLELMSGKDENGDEVDLSLKFYFLGPALMASEAGEEICVAETLEWEDYYADVNSLTHRAIQHLMKMLNIPDEDIIIDQANRKV